MLHCDPSLQPLRLSMASVHVPDTTHGDLPHDAFVNQRCLLAKSGTRHHRDYYTQEGRTPASDFDSPIPNAQIAVRGRFLFVVERPLAWADLATKILDSALCERGIGARTRGGYGLFTQPPTPSCQWVDEQIARLQQETRGNALEQLR